MLAVAPSNNLLWMQSYYNNTLLSGLAMGATEVGCDLLLATHADELHAEGDVGGYGDRCIGIVLVMPPRTSRLALRLSRGTIPTMIIGQRATFNVPHITVDDSVGATAAMRHLFEIGHRSIGHLAGPLDRDDALDRLSAYSTFGRMHGLAMPDRWVGMGDYTYEGAMEIAREILSQPDRPTAIFAANDAMALALLDMAKELRIRVPEELSVIGFDDSQEANCAFPSLTTVNQPVQEMARRCIYMLVDHVRNCTPLGDVVLETGLVVRDSTAPPHAFATV